MQGMSYPGVGYLLRGYLSPRLKILRLAPDFFHIFEVP